MNQRTRQFMGFGAILLVMLAAIGGVVYWQTFRHQGTFEQCHELGYLIEFEYDPATLNMHQSNPDRNGQKYVGVVVQGHYSVMILDGQLTLNREPRGTTQPGDKIKVTLDKRIWVNGQERKASQFPNSP